MLLRRVQPSYADAAATLLLSACGMATPHASGQGAVTRPPAVGTPAAVPWIATTAGAAPTPTPSPMPTPIGLAACQSRNLSARVGHAGGAALDYMTGIVSHPTPAGPAPSSGSLQA
jgi:hypothetical protein